MARKGRMQNLQMGGRNLRLKVKLQTFSDEERIQFESELFDVVRNLDKTVRTETMYDVASKTIKHAKRILQQSKADSLAFSEVNDRSQNLEDRLDFTWTETDTVVIEPPKDIDYAAITDISGTVEIVPQTAQFLHFYWFRFQFSRKATMVHRPGNQYLSKAIQKEASYNAIEKIFQEKLMHEWKNRDNITNEGGNLGSRKRRNNTPPAQRRRNAARS